MYGKEFVLRCQIRDMSEAQMGKNKKQQQKVSIDGIGDSQLKIYQPNINKRLSSLNKEANQKPASVYHWLGKLLLDL